MNYPLWEVPIIGGGWVIGGIAIIHVLISHFAVGGGLYLPMAERKALREGRADWLEVLRGHSRFFLILTGVFGVATGVGIWFAIGLVNPEATSALIHNFVFGWAIEWTFFTVELTTAAVYYYTWGRVSDSLHLTVGWVYALFSLLTLVIINGILTFMLTPGESWLGVAGTGEEATKFWQALFNPTYWPSLGLRTLICISLAGVWSLVTGSRIDGFERPELKTRVIKFSSKWLIPAFLLIPVFFVWYIKMVPVEQRALITLGIPATAPGVFSQVTRAVLVTMMTSATIGAVVYFLAYRNPRDFTFGHACAVLLLALAATASTEQAREMLRKPYVIGQYMYSNGVRIKGGAATVAQFNRDGYLTSTPWATPTEREAWGRMDAFVGAQPTPAPGQPVPAVNLNQVDQRMRLARGELMFRGQCMPCHTLDGYRSVRRLIAVQPDREAIGNLLTKLHEDSTFRPYMPPLVGTSQEMAALGEYLATLLPVKKEGATSVAAKPAAPAPATVAPSPTATPKPTAPTLAK